MSLSELYSEVELTRAQKRSELIAATMRKEIVQALVDGKLREGDPVLPEKAVIDRFAAARSTVREAMRILEGHGLVKYRCARQGGAFVRVPRTDVVARDVSTLMELRGTSVEEIWELRALLETAAVRKLALHQHEGAVARLRQVILDADRDAADSDAVGRHVLEFLDVMISEIDNTAMQITLATVRDILEMEQRVTTAAPVEQPGTSRPGTDWPCEPCKTSSTSSNKAPPTPPRPSGASTSTPSAGSMPSGQPLP